MHVLAVYVKVGLPLALKNTSDSYLFFQQVFLHSVSYFLFLYRLPSLYLRTVFDTISSNIGKVFSSINPPANVFVFEDLNVHHKDWLVYSGGMANW